MAQIFSNKRNNKNEIMEEIKAVKQANLTNILFMSDD